MKSRPHTRGAVALLAAAVVGCVGVIGPGAGASSGADGSGAPLTSPIRRVRRLSTREYDNVVRDLLADTTQPATRFLVDVYQNGYDNGSAGLAVQSDQAFDYQTAAEALAATAVSTRLTTLLGGCDVPTQGEQACSEALLTSFAPRAYRRPLSPTELQRLRDVFQVGSQAGGFAVGIRTVLEVILESPQFLYREELGPLDAPASGSGTLTLTPYEVASELSFMLTGSLPDETLWAAVQQGQFESASDYQREAARLLGSPGARDTLRAFLHEWLATNRLGSLSKDPKFYPTFSPALAASMGSELDQFYDGVLWNGTGSLRELFTSSQSFIDPALGQVYGMSAGPGFQPVTLDPALRKGVLSRAGYLAVHAATDSSGPVSRGVFLLQALLCSPPPPPPANVPPAMPAGDPSAMSITTRQRFDQHVKSAFCASCHTTIDGVGFGFEEFDGIGAFRTTENGQPVDTSGTILGTQEIDGAFSGVPELATKLAGSQHLLGCYTKQAYRFAMGDVEPTSEDLASLREAFSADSKITDVLLKIIADPIFVARAFEGAAP